jgi:type III pantothenate kinase
MSVPRRSNSDPWIALSIGNSRLHWAWFLEDNLQQIDHTLHPALDPPQDWSGWQQLCPFVASENIYPELWVASVVPSQTQLWQHYPNVTILERADIPLQDMYATLGLDRAIALWSAGITYGWPTLVVDGGTALTFTGADAEGRLVGGAILPGLGLQLQSLRSQTAELPWVELPAQLSALWATETETAMQSGVVYGAISGLIYRIEQWLIHHPKAQIILTGGDADLLETYLNLWHQQRNPLDWIQSLKLDAQLLFHGIAAIRSKKTK